MARQQRPQPELQIVHDEYMGMDMRERMKYDFPYNRIADCRKKLGLSQQELAKHLHVTQKYLSDWETNQRRPNLAQAMAIASFLNVSVYELMGVPESFAQTSKFKYNPPVKDPYKQKISREQTAYNYRTWGAPGTMLPKPSAQYNYLGDWQMQLPMWALHKADYLREKIQMTRDSGMVVRPKDDEVFRALVECPLDTVRVVIVSRCPYSKKRELTDGLALSSPVTGRLPGALTNFFFELTCDLGLPYPSSGDLTPWTKRGILLLNVAMTSIQSESNDDSNASCFAPGWSWDDFTGAVLHACSLSKKPKVFLLLGRDAKRLEHTIEEAPYNKVISLVHPNPLSAKKGFFGSRPFSAVNQYMAEMGEEPIDWSLP